MSIAGYFDKLPKDAPLLLLWKHSAELQTKWAKRSPGRPRKTVMSNSPQTVIIADSDREKENAPNTSNTSTSEIEGKNSPSMKWLYGTKHKKSVIAYAKMHSVATAAKHFTIPRITIARWMVDGYFEREVTKLGVKKGAGRLLTYSMEIDEQLLVWVLENRNLHLPITIPLLQANSLAQSVLISRLQVVGLANSCIDSLVLQAHTSMAQELTATLELDSEV